MNSVLLSALDPHERERLKRALSRSRQEGNEGERDQLMRSILDRVNADLQALRDILGFDGEGEDGPDDPADFSR